MKKRLTVRTKEEFLEAVDNYCMMSGTSKSALSLNATGDIGFINRCISGKIDSPKLDRVNQVLTYIESAEKNAA